MLVCRPSGAHVDIYDRLRWFHHRLISGVPPGRRVTLDLCRNLSWTALRHDRRCACGRCHTPEHYIKRETVLESRAAILESQIQNKNHGFNREGRDLSSRRR